MALSNGAQRYFNESFTDAWCDEVAQEFKLEFTAEAKKEIRETISGYADLYDSLKRGNKGKSTYDEDRRKLASASKSIKASKEALADVFDRMNCQMRFHAANRDYAKLGLVRKEEEQGYSEYTDMVGILRFLDCLEKTCESAAKNEYDPPYQNTSVALEISMINLIPMWRRYFGNIEYTAGAHYGKNTKYNSPAIYLMEKIFYLIDADLKRTQIGTALNKAKKSYKQK